MKHTITLLAVLLLTPPVALHADDSTQLAALFNPAVERYSATRMIRSSAVYDFPFTCAVARIVKGMLNVSSVPPSNFNLRFPLIWPDSIRNGIALTQSI